MSDSSILLDHAQRSPVRRAEIAQWLCSRIASACDLPVSQVGYDVPLLRFGLESIEVARLLAEAEDEFNVTIPADRLNQSMSLGEIFAQTGERGIAGDAGFESPACTEDRNRNSWHERIAELNTRCDAARSAGKYLYQTPLRNSRPGYVHGPHPDMLMLASYSYLGLAWRPELVAAVAKASAEYGTGGHGVPMLAGSTPALQALEARLAAFKGAEAAVAFTSGYATNLAVLSALPASGDLIIMDQLVHASLADGARLSRADVIFFRHNDIADLRRCLTQAGTRRALVVVDAVYSMEGDIAPLPEISRCTHDAGALLMVDEAHSLGVLGARGHGIEEHFELPSDTVDIKMGTLSKTIPAVGGYVAGRANLISALKHNGHPYIFSAALPPPCAEIAIAALDIIDREPDLVQRLRSNIEAYIDELKNQGFSLVSHGTPVVPLVCRDEALTYDFALRARAAGLFVVPVTHPAVPIHSPRLRTTVTAAHDEGAVREAARLLGHCAREVGVL